MAGGITESAIEEIKSRIDLADLIASYGVQVKSAGSAKKACCPFHHEKTPSFSINESRGFYHCFGCGESGDAIKFVQRMEGLTFVEAVKKLADQCGVKLESREDPEAGRRARLYALMAELAQFYHRCLLRAKEGAAAREYLRGRDLGEKIQSDYLIGYAPNGAATMLKWAEKYRYSPAELEEAGVMRAPTRPGDYGYHRFGGRLMFTIRDKQGRVVGFSGRQLVASKNSGKYVNSPETTIFKKSSVLYGFDTAARAIGKAPHHEVIVCEGQIDCIRLQTSGFPNAVAGQGTAFTEEHVRMISRLAEQVALVYDDDAAGHKATVRSARLCLAAGLPVRVVSLPGGDDPDSFLRAHPADEFRAMLDNAESIMSFQVRSARAAERDPTSVDAVGRIARELLDTVAACPNAVLRAGMLAEASRLTGLPASALNSELEKTLENAATQKRRPPPQPQDAPADLQDPLDLQEPSEPISGEDAAVAAPPPGEMALCAFLMENEQDKTLDDMVGEFLLPPVFVSDFTVRFISAWRTGVVDGADHLRSFADGLSVRERAWFDRILLEGGKAQASELSAVDNMKNFIRSLWIAALHRRRGGLPAVGDTASEMERLRLSVAAKRLAAVKWHSAKDMIREELRQWNG
ncbi:MAG: DNA primase [Kiritimatiellae bacterium]|nr:DNA primase [Kiritimatiellia bacterium]